jgi:dolichol-phosphate mannosyltransferase
VEQVQVGLRSTTLYVACRVSVMSSEASRRIAVVIPCFGVADHIFQVLRRIGPEVWRIYVVDDRCPENVGDRVESSSTDPRVRVLRHAVNLGVGGAVMTGYRAAIDDGAEVIVKVDGDEQMDPGLLPKFVAPILAGQADYTKGNRFFDLSSLNSMPRMRLAGNAILSLMSKFSTGYWNIFDPTNGYTAIDARVASWLPLESISQRYFFETDMLFRLNTLRAVVSDVPMDALYGAEKSNLKISRILFEFLFKHMVNASKRIFYNYFLRDMSVASLQLVAGTGLFVFGVVWGIVRWVEASRMGLGAPLGTIMLAVLPILLGTQLLLSFLAYDVSSVPMMPCAARFGLKPKKRRHAAASEAASESERDRAVRP